MARIITKELAVKIVDKLGATRKHRKGMAHDQYTFRHGGRVVARLSIRHGSNKDQGHDFIPKNMRITPNEAKLFGQCEYNLDWYIEKMQEKGIIPRPPVAEEDAAEETPDRPDQSV